MYGPSTIKPDVEDEQRREADAGGAQPAPPGHERRRADQREEGITPENSSRG